MFAEEISTPSYGPDKTLRLVKPDVAFAPVTIDWIGNVELNEIAKLSDKCGVKAAGSASSSAT